MKKALCSAVVTLAIAHAASAAIIFDDFNVDEGHFGFAPSFSATSVGEDASSTADRITTDNPFEGEGHQKLVLVDDPSVTTALRIRHLSGGPPYNSSTAGVPSANVAFTVTDGVDGWIGFYVRTLATGWEVQINLDGPANSSGEMRGSTSVPLIADGEWHLYEWDLDAAVWGTVPGVITHATGTLPDGTYTIDSIMFRDMDGVNGPTAEIFIDFVAKSDVGSIAELVIPEPGSVSLLGIGALGLLLRRRRR